MPHLLPVFPSQVPPDQGWNLRPGALKNFALEQRWRQGDRVIRTEVPEDAANKASGVGTQVIIQFNVQRLGTKDLSPSADNAGVITAPPGTLPFHVAQVLTECQRTLFDVPAHVTKVEPSL